VFAIGPFQATYNSTPPATVIVIGYDTVRGFLVFDAEGKTAWKPSNRITIDWRYDAGAAAWRPSDLPPTAPPSATEDVLWRALHAIAEYDHLPSCKLRDDLDVYDCHCREDQRPDALAREALEEIRGE
jgi:hypothetical protein